MQGEYNKSNISIIVPVYNVEKYLERCIESILNQTFTGFELILVDDGSTDLSGDICDKYSKKDKRIKVIHKQNGGLSSARNAGLEIASGDYIAFIDSDDFVAKEYIFLLYENLIENNADISICGYRIVREDDILVKDSATLTNNISILNSHQSLLNLYNEKRSNFIVAWSKLFKKNLFDSIRFPYGKINEDSFVLYKLFLKSIKITYNESKLYYYQVREDSIMHKKVSRKSFDDLDAYEEQIDFYRINGYIEIEKKAIFSYCTMFRSLSNRFKEETNDLESLKLIRKKHKDIKEYVKKNKYYSIEDKYFVYAPWCYEKLIEPYWFIIGIKRKLKKI